MLANDDQLQSALSGLKEAKRSANEVRRRTADKTFKASPKNKMFTIAVGGRGELKSLVFRSDDYRSLPPAELAELLVSTFEKARRESITAALEGLSGLITQVPMPTEMLSQATSVDDFMSTLIEATSQALPDGGAPVSPAPDRKDVV